MTRPLHTPSIALLLADGRFPSGGHAHSNGMEQACDEGAISNLDSVADYVSGRLLTTGVVAMHAAAGACHVQGSWPEFDGELDARFASRAARTVSRQQGKQLLWAGRRTFTAPVLDQLALAPRPPHGAVAQGAVCAAADLPPVHAAVLAGYSLVSSHCSAAVRLLGLDPAGAARLMATLAEEIDSLATEAGIAVARQGWSPSCIPALSSPMADLLGEIHHARKERLFAS